MLRSKPYCFAFALAGLLALEACAPFHTATGPVSAGGAAQSNRYIVLFTDAQVPGDFQDRVAGLGGSVESSLGEIGMAIVAGLTEAAAAELASAPDIRGVEHDPVVRERTDHSDASGNLSRSVEAEGIGSPAAAGRPPWEASFYDRQWNMEAIHAREAWEAGHTGSTDVVVAIVDTGIDYLHPDLVGLVDLERSRSFVPEDEPVLAEKYPGRLPFSDLFWHGTAMADIVASNAEVLAGINKNVTLMAVKVADKASTFTAGRLITGIVYAANQGADVINVSMHYDVNKRENPATAIAFELAAAYALLKGALIVSISSNDNADLDNNGDVVRYPCEAYGVICASASGKADIRPVDPAGAFYSGYGSAVDVAAPGGSGPIVPDPLASGRLWLVCTSTPTDTTVPPVCRNKTAPVVSGFGTSGGAAHTSGLAALLVAQLGHNKPALIRARILQSVDDVGDPGTDPYFGRGRINIARALKLIP
jgi:subtilisin family serine protease